MNINFNGNILSETIAVITNKNRSFRYGDGLFESIKIINGEPCLLKLHIERLIEGMRILKMEIPSIFSSEYFNHEIKKLLIENKISEGGRVKIIVYRNDGGLYTPNVNAVNFIIEAEATEENKYVLNPKGLKIDLYDEIRKPINKLSAIKSNNSLIYVLASIYKKEKELDDCILLNEFGNIVESTNSNIFIVKKKEIYTPLINEGCIAGVMRKQVIEMAVNSRLVIKECVLPIDEFFVADEIFLTNATSGIRWVGAFQRKRYYNTIANFLTGKLNLL